jgi:endonuclease YncB( thermonuclease family)
MLSGVNWPCGQNAARALTSVTNGKVVTCKGNRRDRYGRLVAICYVGADDLNARMVREGWALAYRRYASDYVDQEVQARAAGSGIWQGQFIEPWDWRRQSRAAD